MAVRKNKIYLLIEKTTRGYRLIYTAYSSAQKRLKSLIYMQGAELAETVSAQKRVAATMRKKGFEVVELCNLRGESQ